MPKAEQSARNSGWHKWNVLYRYFIPWDEKWLSFKELVEPVLTPAFSSEYTLAFRRATVMASIHGNMWKTEHSVYPCTDFAVNWMRMPKQLYVPFMTKGSAATCQSVLWHVSPVPEACLYAYGCGLFVSFSVFALGETHFGFNDHNSPPFLTSSLLFCFAGPLLLPILFPVTHFNAQAN